MSASASMEEIFGPVISSYSRAQAIEDGVLIDVSDTDAARLFKYPAVVTVELHSAISRGAGSDPATYAARLWDVFYVMQCSARRTNDSDVFFRVKVGRSTLALRGNCGPGDDAAPVLTLGFPENF
jgi:hypothetical protein